MYAGKQDEILFTISNEIAAIRGKEDMLRVIRDVLNQYISFDDSFIIRYSKAEKRCNPYIFHPTKSRIKNAGLKRFIELQCLRSVDKGLSENYLAIHKSGTTPIEVAEYSAAMNEAAIKEYVVLKLIESKQLIGFFILLSESHNSFGQDSLDLLNKLSYQLSIATANIIAGEELEKKEVEKAILLALSYELAALRNRNDLFSVVRPRLKQLFGIEDFGITQINENSTSYSVFLPESGDQPKNQFDYRQMTGTYDITDCVFGPTMRSSDPILFHVNDLLTASRRPLYVDFWKKAAVTDVVSVSLKVGGKINGCVFLHTGHAQARNLNESLLKETCAHLSLSVFNILSHEKINAQLTDISRYKQQLEQEKLYLKEEIATTQNYDDIVGDGPEMNQVFRMINQVASSQSTVLLLGETGTGKELVARAIHTTSPRKNKLMVKVNCAALPANLIESELFGHEKGSFTGATERRLGKFELANNGTLFLDEIGEMPLELQVKLLRAIQEREIERVGSSNTIKVDVRIIAATNRDLEKMMEEGKFRGDLYYRLNIFPIPLPPLRERKQDIPALAAHFIERYSSKAGRPLLSFSSQVLNELIEYHWPGNIRELEHLIERSVLLAKGDTINEIHLHSGKNKTISVNGNIPGKIKTIDDNEKEHILYVIRHCKGRISGVGGAAELLGVPASTLNSKIKKLGIKKEYFS